MTFARHLRPRLLGATALVCAGAAIGQMAVIPGSGSYQATANPINGSATVTTGPGTTNVQVNAATAVINWTPIPAPSGSAPSTGPIDFQPAGTTATFSNAQGVGNYVVLNRILPGNPDRSIIFSGANNATVDGQPGGTLWYYSPGGIVLGAGASFNVGSLLLSTSDITYNANTGTVDPAQASLLGTASGTPFKASGTISVASGASITASNYVALFAPRVQQDGNVTANGGVAYVAANAGTLTFPSGNGLFSMVISDGTAPNDGNPEVLRHSGTTTGAVRNANSTGRTMYFVAVPKNVAITALLGGSIGYQQATGVTTGVGDTVVLTSQAVTSGSFAPDLAAPGAAGLTATVQNAAVRGDFYGSAQTVALNAIPSNSFNATLSFGGSANVQASTASVFIAERSSLGVTKGMTINAYWGDTGTDPARRVGGTANLRLSGITIIGNDFKVDAGSKGALGAGGSVTGGTIGMTIDNGALFVGTTGAIGGGGLTLTAQGIGSEGTASVAAGDGTGGVVTVNQVNAFVTIGRSLGLDVTGYGGAGARPAASPSPFPSGSPGSEILPDVPMSLGANYGGDGSGGSITLTTSGTTQLTARAGIVAYGRGFGGNASVDATGGVFGGEGDGGTIDLILGGTAVIAPSVELSATGSGGAGQNAVGGDFINGVYIPRRAGNGGYAEGGQITVDLNTRLESNTISITADASGGLGGSAFRSPNPALPFGNSGSGGNGGEAQGGQALLRVLSAGELIRSTQATGLTILAGARGGGGGSSVDASAGYGGSAQSGDISIETRDGGGDLATPRLEANVVATGGNGGATGGGNAHGGSAVGGSVTIDAAHGAIRTDAIVLSTVANRGVGQRRLVGSQLFADSNPSGDGRGGDVNISAGDADNGTSGTITGALSIDTYALFQTAEASGGYSQGGTVHIDALRGSNLAFTSARIDARASSADAMDEPGGASSGLVMITADTEGALAVSGATVIDTRAIGGRNLGNGSTGSYAEGGAVQLTADLDGTIGLGASTTINTSAVGGGHGGESNGGFGAAAGNVALFAGSRGAIRAAGPVSIDATAGYTTIDALPFQGVVHGGSVTLIADSATLALSGPMTANVSARVANGAAGSIAIGTSGDVSGLAPSFIAGANLNADGIGPTGTLLGAIGQITLFNRASGLNMAGNNVMAFTGPLNAIAIGTLGFGEGEGGEGGIIIRSEDARIRVDGVATINTNADVAIIADGSGGIDFRDSATISTAGFDPVHTNRTAGTYTIGGGDVIGSTLTITASELLNATSGTTIFGHNVVLTGAGIDADDVTSRNTMMLTALGGSVNAGILTAGTNLTVEADDDITIDRASGTRVTVDAGGAATITADLATADFRGYTAGGDLTVNSGSGFGVTFAQVAGDLALYSDNAIAIDDVAAARNINVSGSSILLGTASGPFAHSINASGTVDIVAREGSITSQNNAINAAGAISLTAGDNVIGGGFVNGVFGSELAVTSTGGNVTVDAVNDVTVGSLRGVDLVRIRAGRDVTVGQVAATGRVAITGGADPARGTVSLAAGLVVAPNGQGSYVRGDLRIVGSVTAPGNIALSAGDSIFTEDNFRIESGNRVTLNAANDIRLAIGGGVRSGLDSASAANAALTIAAGSITAPAGVDGPGNVRGLIVDTLLNAGAGAITLSGDAIQADVGRIVTSGNVTLTLAGAPGGNGIGNGSVPLRPECGDGNICVGQADVGGRLTIGSLSNAAVSPLTARLTGAINAGNLDVAANRILLGDSATPITVAIAGTGTATLLARTGEIAGDRATISGAGATLSARGAGITLGTVTVGTADLDAGSGALTVLTNISADTLFARGGMVTLNATGALDIDVGLARGGAFIATSAGPLSFTTISGGTVNLTSGSTLTGGSVTGFGGITLRANGDLTTTSLNAINPARSPSPISATSVTGALQLGTVTTDGAITGRAATGIGFTALNGGSIDLETVSGNLIAARIVTPGTVRLVAGGDVTVTDELGSSGATLRGRRVLAHNLNGPLNVTSAIATGGDVTLSARDALAVAAGTATGGFSATSTAGAVNAGALSAGGSLSLNGATGASFTSLTGADIAIQGGSGAIAGGATVTIGAQGFQTNGAVTVASLGTGATTARGSGVSLTGPGAITIASATATAGDVRLRAGGALAITAATASGAIDAATTAGAIQLGTAIAGGLIQARGPGDIGFTRLSAVNVALESTAGRINGARLGATGTVGLTAAGQITISQLDSGNVTALGSAVSLTAPAALQVTSVIAEQAGIELASVGDMTVGAARARTYIDLASSAGAVTIGDARIGGGVVGGAVRPEAVTTNGAITVNAATTATLNGAVAATGPLSVTAATIAINGVTSGGTAAFRSGAIALGSAATITSPGIVTFQNTGVQRTFIGGTGGSGYALSGAAFQQVRSGGIAVIAPAVQNAASSGPDVTIGTMTLTSGTNLAAGAAFTVTTPGTIQVVGDARIAGADANNAIRFNAGQAIGITLPAGSLAVLDGAGNPTGTIELTAPRITVATASAAADILTATTTAARMVRLATNDGAVNDRGALAAGQLTFRIRDALYIQNTGGAARADRRGFTAGSGGFAVIATGTGQPEFVVNGRIGTLTGDAALPASRLSNTNNATGNSLFIGASSVNDCTLAQGCPVPVTPPIQQEVIPPVIGIPTQDVVGFIIDDPEDAQAVEEALRVAAPTIQPPLIELAPAQPFSFSPPVDEPVTGSGNDSLWTGIGIGNAAEGNGLVGGAAITGTGIDRDGVAPANTGTGQDRSKDTAADPTPKP